MGSTQSIIYLGSIYNRLSVFLDIIETDNKNIFHKDFKQKIIALFEPVLEKKSITLKEVAKFEVNIQQIKNIFKSIINKKINFILEKGDYSKIEELSYLLKSCKKIYSITTEMDNSRKDAAELITIHEKFQKFVEKKISKEDSFCINSIDETNSQHIQVIRDILLPSIITTILDNRDYDNEELYNALECYTKICLLPEMDNSEQKDELRKIHEKFQKFIKEAKTIEQVRSLLDKQKKILLITIEDKSANINELLKGYETFLNILKNKIGENNVYEQYKNELNEIELLIKPDITINDKHIKKTDKTSSNTMLSKLIGNIKETLESIEKRAAQTGSVTKMAQVK